MRPPKWFGTVLKGRIKLDNKPRFLEYLAGFEGKRVELVLKGYDPQGGDSDRGYYFSEIVEAFALHMGYPKEEYYQVHNVIKEMMHIESTKKFKSLDWKEYVAGVKRQAAQEGVLIREKKHIDLEEEGG
jgi:hypothetical protein